MTFKPVTLNIPPLQEGNLADFLEVNFGANFPLTDVSEIVLKVQSKGTNKPFLTKRLSEGKITVAGQNMVIPLVPEDTANHAGDFEYELDFHNGLNQPFATFKGKGTIEREIK